MNFGDKRVVITGTGVVSSVGNTVDAMWESLINGVSGIGPFTVFDASEYRTRIAGEIKDFNITDFISTKEARKLDPFCHYAIVAADEAVKQAGLDIEAIDNDRFGVFIGSGIGGITTLQEQMIKLQESGPSRVSPFLIPMMISDMAAGAVSIRLNAKGPNFSIISACATGSHCIGEAFWVIKRGDADIMLCGGAEACLSPIGVAGFCAMRAMTSRNDEPTKASRPFDKDRDGFIISEGSGVLLLETLEHAENRGANILAEIVGYGSSGDAYHITSPAPDGEGAVRALKICLERGGIAPEEVDYINAHGTSTPLNDKNETLAIKTVLGEHAYNTHISSTKSLTGHTLGAAGGIEASICVKVINEGKIPGTYNYETPDPDCDLNYVPNQTLEKDVNIALSSNFGFGGHNAVLALKKYK
ncbi:MAG: beta-ketoacyl-ACP synthase II [Lentisphaeria bacterium]|nr:beta-ketoacyl-ACP synthase II [Lentisphaeria bacterium]NQZ68266.1 beta-ketoacyl-ACP synthase II [Lentisphaeria bacterium]